MIVDIFLSYQHVNVKTEIQNIAKNISKKIIVIYFLNMSDIIANVILFK